MSERADYIRGLRALADLLEQHPHLSLPYGGAPERPTSIYPSRYTGGDVAAQALTYVAAMDARPVAKFKVSGLHDDPDYWLEITGSLGGLHVEVNFRTAEVCEARGAGGWVIPDALLALVDVAAAQAETGQATPAQAVDAWNATVPVGTPVRYWTGVREGEGKLSRTRTEAQVLGGHTAVVWMEGEPSCVALTHVAPIASQTEASC